MCFRSMVRSNRGYNQCAGNTPKSRKQRRVATQTHFSTERIHTRSNLPREQSHGTSKTQSGVTSHRTRQMTWLLCTYRTAYRSGRAMTLRKTLETTCATECIGNNWVDATTNLELTTPSTLPPSPPTTTHPPPHHHHHHHPYKHKRTRTTPHTHADAFLCRGTPCACCEEVAVSG